MPVDAIMRHSSPVMVDHTPSADFTQGEVLQIGDTHFVAHRPGNSGVLRAVAALFGVYEMIAGEAMSPGSHVFFNNSTRRVQLTAPVSGKAFGLIVGTKVATAAGQKVDVLHLQSLPATGSIPTPAPWSSVAISATNITTTDDTETTLVSTTVPTDSVCLVVLRSSARRTDAAGGAVFERKAAVSDSAGLLETPPRTPTTIPSTTPYAATIDMTGTTVRGRITGAIGHTVDWWGSLTLYCVTS